VTYEPSLAESWGQREWERAYGVTRRAVLAWAGLRLLSLPLLLLMGFAAAYKRQKDALTIPILKWLAVLGIFVVTPLVVLAAVGADVGAAISGRIVVLASGIQREW
jgi:hypothetical protein